MANQVIWLSDNAGIVASNGSGLFTGVASGQTDIEARAIDSFGDACQGNTHVIVAATALASISVTPSSPAIQTGATQQLAATGTYSGPAGSQADLSQDVQWVSSNPTVGTVNSSGLAKGLTNGLTTISAANGSVTGTGTLLVGNILPFLSSISVQPASPSIFVGQMQQFKALGTYVDGSATYTTDISSAVQWSSSSAAAGVSATGLATGVSIGSATITATLNNTLANISGTASLSVQGLAPVLTSIAVTPNPASVQPGQMLQFAATGTYSDGSNQNLTAQAQWSSSIQGVATISSGGFATGVNAGSTVITASIGAVSGADNLTVGGSFSLGTPIINTIPALAVSVAVGDVNGDGKPDLVVAAGDVYVLLGNGDGTFQAPVKYSASGQAVWVAVGDLNLDNKLDIVVALGPSTNPGSIGVLLGNGDGTFKPLVSYMSGDYGAQAVTIADVNHDGKPDVVVANCGLGCGLSLAPPASVSVLLGNGDGTFGGPSVNSSGGQDATDLVVADMNGDGIPDIVVSDDCTITCTTQQGAVGILLGNGDGTFKPVQTFVTGGPTTSLAVGDINGDGKPDVAVACQTYGSGTLLGNGDGTLQAFQSVNTGSGQDVAVALKDVNGDGRLDLIIANGYCNTVCGSGGGLDIALGNGDGTFQAPLIFNSGGYAAWSVAVADLNGDGKPDFAVANLQGPGNPPSPASNVAVLLNLF